MRIAMLGPAAPRELMPGQDSVPEGLVGTPVTALVKAMIAAGHEVVLVTASPDIETSWSGRAGPLTVHVTPYRRRARHRALDLFAAERKGMALALESEDVDVVHAHWSYEFGWVGVRSGRPTVLTVHDAPLTILRFMPNAYRLARTAMAYRVRMAARNVTAVSPYLAEGWRRQMLYRSEIQIIPNIVPELPVTDASRSATPTILDIADSGRRKNVPNLIRAFALLRETTPDAKLVLIGGGLEADGEIAEWTRSRGIAEGVSFLGTQSRVEISRRLSEATLFCHPSLEEAQPMCLLEAMSSGVPIVAGRDAGGVPWTLDHGNAGYLADMSSAPAIAEAMKHLIDSPELAGRYKHEGTLLMERRYTPQAVASKYLAEYQSAIETFGKKSD